MWRVFFTCLQDEQERINNMGGVVVNCVGVLRVNGFLSISRAIGKHCARFYDENAKTKYSEYEIQSCRAIKRLERSSKKVIKILMKNMFLKASRNLSSVWRLYRLERFTSRLLPRWRRHGTTLTHRWRQRRPPGRCQYVVSRISVSCRIPQEVWSHE